LDENFALAALAKPFGTPATLRVGAIEDLMPAGALWVIGVGQTLGDDALEVGLNHGPVQRPAFANDTVGERYPRSRPATSWRGS
jgi:hypothetical protein